MTTTDREALRTRLRVRVEEVCHGAKWVPMATPEREWLVRPGARTVAYRNNDGSARLRAHALLADPTTDIGAAMALVDSLQAEGDARSGRFVDTLWWCHGAIEPDDYLYVDDAWEWVLMECPPALRPLVLTLAVLAARAAEDWREYLPLLEEK